MKNVKELSREIILREGGFVNDPDDPGGATNFGVTIHTMRRLGLDLDADGDVDTDDVRRLTLEQAAEIFEEQYFVKPRISEMPDILQATIFDMQVNAGGNAIKILQELLNRAEYGPLKVDGAIGSRTLAAAHLAANAHGQLLVDAYGIARRNYYYSLADRRARSRKYARRRDGGKGGWIRRAEEFISPTFHFSEADHNRRVSAWD